MAKRDQGSERIGSATQRIGPLTRLRTKCTSEELITRR
jgi:hypothetical protein